MNSLVSLMLVSLAGSALVNARCPGKDWIHRRGTDKCYFIYTDVVPRPELGPVANVFHWESAANECKLRGGRLATIEDEAELEYLTAKFDRLTDYWVAMTYENLKWQWKDGDNFTDYKPIRGLEIPDFIYEMTNHHKSEMRLSLEYIMEQDKIDFVIKSNTIWLKGGYICKAEYSNKPWCNTEENWIYFGEKCYKHFVEPKTFDQATSICQAAAGYLYVPNTKNKDERYKDWMRAMPNYNIGWIGISIPKKTAATRPENITWQDGTPMAKTAVNNWPNRTLSVYVASLANNKRYCGEMYSRKGFYESVYDDYYLDWDYEYVDQIHDWSLRDTCGEVSPFICEAPIIRTENVDPVVIQPDISCRAPFIRYHDGCYLVTKDQKTREDAQKTCEQQSSTLAIINTFGENLRLRDLVDNDAWIGIKIEGKNTTALKWIYKYSDGTVVPDKAFTIWGDSAQYLQNNATFISNCVLMAGKTSTVTVVSNFPKPPLHGHWYHAPCDQKKEFMCYYKV